MKEKSIDWVAAIWLIILIILILMAAKYGLVVP